MNTHSWCVFSGALCSLSVILLWSRFKSLPYSLSVIPLWSRVFVTTLFSFSHSALVQSYSHCPVLFQSFRFGPEISQLASTILELFKGEHSKNIVGHATPGQTVFLTIFGDVSVITFPLTRLLMTM